MSVHMVALGEVADINPRGPGRGELAADAEVDFVPMASVSEGGQMTVQERRTYDEVSKGFTAFKPGDVLVAKITPCYENNKIAKSTVSTEYAFGSTEFHVVRGKPDALDHDYLTYFLRQDYIREAGERRMTGSGGQRRVPKTFLEELKIPLPPLEEQKRIAGILDQAAELCRLRTRALEKLNTLGQAIFRATEERVEGHLVGIEEIADIQIGHPFKSAKYTGSEEGVRLCRGANVLPGAISWKDTARYPEDELASHAQFELREGDVVLAMDRPWISSGFKVARISSEDLPSYLVQRVARFRAKRYEDQAFLMSLISGGSFQRHCRPTETTVPHISPKEIKSFRFGLPSADVRARMAANLRNVDVTKQAMRMELDKSTALFASLQHRAFRGELGDV